MVISVVSSKLLLVFNTNFKFVPVISEPVTSGFSQEKESSSSNGMNIFFNVFIMFCLRILLLLFRDIEMRTKLCIAHFGIGY